MTLEFKEDPNKEYFTLIAYYNDKAIGEISRKEYNNFWFWFYGIDDYMLDTNLSIAKQKAIKYVESLETFFNKYFK